MADSIFTKIIRGEIPAHKIYEDDKTFAILDHNPKSPGHTLVIPKKQVTYIWDLSEEDYQDLMSSVRKVGFRLKEVLKPKWVGIAVQGLAVPHAHVHVFPFNSIEEYNHIPDPEHFLPESELDEIARKLEF
jgi:histidine triad (HIT) family protein